MKKKLLAAAIVMGIGFNAAFATEVAFVDVQRVVDSSAQVQALKKEQQAKAKDMVSFIEKARKVHGDKYDYSKVEYNGTTVKVCITCPNHGDFWQLPYVHIRGNGCPKCAGKNKTTEDFIEAAKSIHNNKYDYSKINYIDSTTKVPIICPKHGIFWQTPKHHLGGHGCPVCKESNLEKEVRCLLEKNEIKYEISYRSQRHSKTVNLCFFNIVESLIRAILII